MTDESAHHLVHAIIHLTEAIKESHSKHETNVILHRLTEMEQRLIEAIAKSTEIAPSLEAAAMKVQRALDKLDATIPDKKES